MINRTNWEHGLLSLATFAVIFSITSMPLVAWIAPIAFFLGREHAQREYKLGGPGTLVGYEAFDFINWTLDEKLDLAFPIVFSSIACLLVMYLGLGI